MTLVIVSSRAVIHPLKSQEIVHGSHRDGIRARDTDLPTARQRVHGVAQHRAPRRHNGGSGHDLRVHSSRDREVAGRETLRNVIKVRSNDLRTHAVDRVALQHDSPTVCEILEDVA